MNCKIVFSLTEYQRAILTEMGISCWQQIDSSADVSGTDLWTKSDDPNSLQVGSRDEFFQRHESAQTRHEKRLESIPQHILLLMTESQSAQPIINDVLNTLKFPQNAVLTVSQGDLEDYADFLLAWKVGSDMAFDGTILSTPDLSQISSPEVKKRLWQVLQNCHLVT